MNALGPGPDGADPGSGAKDVTSLPPLSPRGSEESQDQQGTGKPLLTTTPTLEASGPRSVTIRGSVVGSVINTGDVIVKQVTSLLGFEPRPYQWALATLALIVLVLGALLVIYQFLSPPAVSPTPASPKRMTGNVNLAVAQFSVDDASRPQIDSQRVEDLASLVQKRLDLDLGAASGNANNVSTQVWPPQSTGPIGGKTAAEQALSARLRAEEIGADVLVYGTAATENNRLLFVINVYISPRKLFDAEELAGVYGFKAPLRNPGNLDNPATFESLSNQLIERTRPFPSFLLGLGYYANNDPGQARSHFSEALAEWTKAENRWGDDGSGQDITAMMNLFLGNTQIRDRDLDGADSFYGRVLQLDAASLRARLGKAEVLYLRSGGGSGCQPGQVDEPQLRQARRAYEEVGLSISQFGNQPSVVGMRAKRAYGQGRVALCMSKAGIEDGTQEAEREFRSVAAEFESVTGGDDRIRDLAAKSYFLLGYLYLPSSDDPDGTAKTTAYLRAMAEFQKALDNSSEQEVVAESRRMIDHISSRLGTPTP